MGVLPFAQRAGFTLLEVMTAIVIILILASMLLPLYSSFMSRSEQARCMANLRNLYVAANSHLQAAGFWPQIPNTLINDDPKTYAKSWVATLKPYGIEHSSWICPTLQKSLGISLEALEKDENYRIDYIAAAFDDKPMSPWQSQTFPWFLERASLHPRGQLIIMTNGATTSLLDLVEK